MSNRANDLAERLEQGALELEKFANELTEAQWEMRGPKDARKVGVVVHHVATVYPLEIQLAQAVAGGNAVTDLTWDTIHQMNAKHSRKYDGVTKEETLALLRENSAAAAAAIRAMNEEDFERAASVSFYGNAPLTCQFLLEDHAVRHSYHHLARLRDVLK
jgi:hypothetical protein